MAALLTKTLGVICPNCDFLNVVGAVRCMTCGTATDAPTSVSMPKLDTAKPRPTLDSSADTTMPGVQTPQAPPGLRRTATPIEAELVEPPPAAVPQSSPSQIRSQPQPAAPAAPKYGLSVLAGPARGQKFRLGANGAQVGRSRGIILFPEDPFISPLHATLAVRDGKLFIRDESSTSGVYVSINGQETVANGALFATGIRLFRFVGSIEPEAPWNRRDVLVYGAPLPNNVTHYLIEEVLLGDRPGRGLITPGPVFTIGQGKCDFSYANDEGLAARHCEVAPLPSGAMIRDLSSGLGTYVRIQQERALKPGDRLRIGQQTLQVEQL